MNSNSVIKKEESQHIEDYRKRMKCIEFMHQYLDDPQIFNWNSIKFKSFLIQSFAHLHPDFHYLSFLNNDDVDQELIKVAGILQILPAFSVEKSMAVFENMSDTDSHKFWFKFFSLFDMKKCDNLSFESTLNSSFENKFAFLKCITTTLNYLKYDFPVVSYKKFISIDLNQEIEKWNEQCNSKVDTIFNENEVSDHDFAQEDNVNIEKLIIDIKHIGMTYKDLDLAKQENKPDYNDIFVKFIETVKGILKYNNDLGTIDASFFNNVLNELLSGESKKLSENLYFIKNCNNLIKILKSKINILE